ncbi:MAG: hypothetical protein AABX88_02645 [Nanoarchaeota archaeon]
MNLRNKKAAMEMSVGTIVTIVLLMTVLILGLFLVRNIFSGATESVDSVNAQVKSEIDNLFSTQEDEIIVSLGQQHTANVKRGTENFGFVFGFHPDDPTELLSGDCTYDIEVVDAGQYCTEVADLSQTEIEDWFISGTSGVEFDKFSDDAGYALVSLTIPENIPICQQKFQIKISCTTDKSYFVINVLKQGMF